MIQGTNANDSVHLGASAIQKAPKLIFPLVLCSLIYFVIHQIHILSSHHGPNIFLGPGKIWGAPISSDSVLVGVGEEKL